jgi:hypothetical protein
MKDEGMRWSSSPLQWRMRRFEGGDAGRALAKASTLSHICFPPFLLLSLFPNCALSPLIAKKALLSSLLFVDPLHPLHPPSSIRHCLCHPFHQNTKYMRQKPLALVVFILGFFPEADIISLLFFTRGKSPILHNCWINNENTKKKKKISKKAMDSNF